MGFDLQSGSVVYHIYFPHVNFHSVNVVEELYLLIFMC